MTYEGWANYETWNTVLWIDNEYPLYQAKVAWLRRCHEVKPQDVKNFVLDLMPNGTPDFDDLRDYEKVDWNEIAEHWTIEANELSS